MKQSVTRQDRPILSALEQHFSYCLPCYRNCFIERPFSDLLAELGISLGLGAAGGFLVLQARSKKDDQPDDVERDLENHLPDPGDGLP